jgi:hypothetical protein
MIGSTGKVGLSCSGDSPTTNKFRTWSNHARILIPYPLYFMATPKKRGAYRFVLREGYVSYLDVDAATESEAMEKVRAFYAANRKPKSSYFENGVHSVLDTNSVSLIRKAKSSWKKNTQVAARSTHRDAVKRTDAASSAVDRHTSTSRVSYEETSRN